MQSIGGESSESIVFPDDQYDLTVATNVRPPRRPERDFPSLAQQIKSNSAIGNGYEKNYVGLALRNSFADALRRIGTPNNLCTIQERA
jgi:hypothetical protein